MFLTIPALVFNTYMLTEAVTVDEAMYIPVFGDITSIEPGSVMWSKASYQYRTTQMIIGTIFRIWRKLYPDLNAIIANIAYKIIHWIFFLCIAFTITYIWSKYILAVDLGTEKHRISTLGIVYILTGTPLACMLLKVCNYDSGSIYFSLLGLSLAIAADKEKKPRYAAIGVIAATLGCLDKWSSLIYWAVCVAFYAYLIMCETKKSIKCIIFSCFRAVISMVGISSALCIINHFYLRILYGKGLIDISFATALFPLYFMLRTLFGGQIGEVNFESESAYDKGVAGWLILLTFVICIAACVILFLEKILMIKVKKCTIIAVINSTLSFLTVISGMIAVYVLTRYVYPFTSFSQEMYKLDTIYSGISFHYGANTFIGHITDSCFYANGVIMTNMPTIELLAFLISVFMMIGKGGDDYLSQLTLLMGTLIIPIFTLAGQPAVPRYFGVTIMIYGLMAVYYLTKPDYDKIKIPCCLKKTIQIIVGILYVTELGICLPLYACFSPLWLIRTDDFKNTIRQGQWAAGESMTWGEETALAGRIINKDIKERNLDPKDVTIISDYGQTWFYNPGFRIMNAATAESDPDVIKEENTYYIFVKFALYRNEIPDFIYETEPVGIVEIRGEKTAWIYTADQIMEVK